jgi:hypothetical protein
MGLRQIKPALLLANKFPLLGRTRGLGWGEVFGEQSKVATEQALLG